MAQLKCICGNTLSNCRDPNDVEGVLINNHEYSFDDRIDCCELTELGRDVWECNKCGRLAISYPDKHSNKVKWYKPEDDKSGQLMSFEELGRHNDRRN